MTEGWKRVCSLFVRINYGYPGTVLYFYHSHEHTRSHPVKYISTWCKRKTAFLCMNFISALVTVFRCITCAGSLPTLRLFQYFWLINLSSKIFHMFKDKVLWHDSIVKQITYLWFVFCILFLDLVIKGNLTHAAVSLYYWLCVLPFGHWVVSDAAEDWCASGRMEIIVSGTEEDSAW